MDIDTETDIALIPASSFPHIIDTIIAYACPAVLIAFRNTCTEYRKRITEERVLESLLDGADGLHLHLDMNNTTRGAPGYAAVDSSDHLVATFPTRHGPCPAPTYAASHVRIVTLQGTVLKRDFATIFPAARILEDAKACLDVVRITDFEGATGTIPFLAPKYVLFMDADHGDEEDGYEDAYSDVDQDDNEGIFGHMDIDELDHMDGLSLPTNSNSGLNLPSNSTTLISTSTSTSSTGSSPSASSSFSSSLSAGSHSATCTPAAQDTVAPSPFPDTVTEIVCNIACAPTASCTHLTRSQLAALNLGHRRILSNVIYIFQPIVEKVDKDTNNSNSHARGHESKQAVRVSKPSDKVKGGGGDATKTAAGTGTHTRRIGTRSATSSPASSAPSTPPSRSPARSPPRSPPESPALVPFLDSQLSAFPNPDFTIVGCENLRYWADPESTLFARFASIMNDYCDFEISLSRHLAQGGFNGGNVGLGLDFGDEDLSRSKYFKSFPQWTASLARSPHQRAWYELITVP